MNKSSISSDFTMPAFWAGLTCFVWYAFGALPLHVAVSVQLGLTSAETSSWVFIVWFTGAVTSIFLSIKYRQPIPITWTIPGMIYIGTLAGQYSFAEILGANLVAGIAITFLGIYGFGQRIMTWMPLPIIMGMFAGSILIYVTRMVEATVTDASVAGLTVAAYLVGRGLKNPKLPPMGLAVVIGGIAAWLWGDIKAAAVPFELPNVELYALSFNPSAMIAVSLPLIILTMGLGNIQGLGFLVAQGYKVPVTQVTVAVGINSMINALFGGHPGTVARAGAAIVASEDAGPMEKRYCANLVASGLVIFMALSASSVAALVGILPKSFVFALAGLAIFTSLQGAVEKAFQGKLAFGALVAFAVSATPFAVAGITSAVWAIVAGIGASLIAEREDLLLYWKGSDPESP